MKEIIALIILFICYVSVLICAICDCRSGKNKAKRNGEPVTSEGFRRTVDKLAKYYNVMIALTAIDVMQCLVIYMLNTYYTYNVPMLPLLTLLGGICMCLIEIHSIGENAADKTKKSVQEVGEFVKDIADNKTNVGGLVEVATDFLVGGKEDENK